MSNRSIEALTRHVRLRQPLVGRVQALDRKPSAPPAPACPAPSLRTSVVPETVLVAVPALNEEAHLERCLRSLLGDDDAMRRVRIVVADGGSADRTRDVVHELAATYDNIRLIENPDRLQSAGVNRVVAECAELGHRYLVRCDAHAVYPPAFPLRVAESLAAREAEALVTPMDARGSGCFQRAAAWVADTPLGSGGSPHRGGRVAGYVDHGHHAGFRLDWFRRIGGYDEAFSHNEDAEFDRRLILGGGRIWLDPELRLDYQMRASLGALARQYWYYGRGRARTMLKHRMVPKARQLIPVANLVFLLLCGLLALVQPLFLLGPAAYVAALGFASLVLTVRHRSLCGLWCGPALAALHLPWGAGFLWQLLSRGDRG
jgi:succinoglycan biosynthesis protein ExoA